MNLIKRFRDSQKKFSEFTLRNIFSVGEKFEKNVRHTFEFY